MAVVERIIALKGRIEIPFHRGLVTDVTTLQELELLEANPVRFWSEAFGMTELNCRNLMAFAAGGEICTGVTRQGRRCRKIVYSNWTPSQFRSGIDDRCPQHQEFG